MLEEKKKCDMILHYITLYYIIYSLFTYINRLKHLPYKMLNVVQGRASGP